MRSVYVVCLASIMGVTVACGGSEKSGSSAPPEGAPAGEVAQPAPAAPAAQPAPGMTAPGMTAPGQGGDPSQQVAQGYQQMMQGMQQMAQGLNQPGVQPVDFRGLGGLFPELSGWTKGESTGERMTAPVAYSIAKVTYTKGDSRIEAQITDTSLHQMLIAPYTMMLNSGFEKESSSGYEKTTKVNGNPAFEKWNSTSGSGEINLLTRSRYLVNVKGRKLEGPQPLQELAGKIDLSKLPAGPQ